MNEQERFEKFTKELAELSKKYGIIIESTGGVYFEDPSKTELKDIKYLNDATSGDLVALHF